MKLQYNATGAYILGPRAGRFKEGKVVPITGHSLPLVSLGGFILIMGFMAFNGGSQESTALPRLEASLGLTESPRQNLS